MWTVAPDGTWTWALTYITARALGSAATDLVAYRDVSTVSGKQRIGECVHSAWFFPMLKKPSFF